MNSTDVDKKNQQKNCCKKCGKIVGLNYRGKKQKCTCRKLQIPNTCKTTAKKAGKFCPREVAL